MAKKIYTTKEAFDKLGKVLGDIFNHVEEKDRKKMISSVRNFTKGYLDAEKLYGADLISYGRK